MAGLRCDMQCVLTKSRRLFGLQICIMSAENENLYHWLRFLCLGRTNFKPHFCYLRLKGSWKEPCEALFKACLDNLTRIHCRGCQGID